jgi:hypothetical protein
MIQLGMRNISSAKEEEGSPSTKYAQLDPTLLRYVLFPVATEGFEGRRAHAMPSLALISETRAPMCQRRRLQGGGSRLLLVVQLNST